jgi:MoxR-like ATPase
MGAVTDAINAEIEQLHVEPVSPGLAELATSLARSVDEADAPTARAVAARELRAVMHDLRKLAPAEAKGDAVDDIAEQRAKRRAAAREQASG